LYGSKPAADKASKYSSEVFNQYLNSSAAVFKPGSASSRCGYSTFSITARISLIDWCDLMKALLNLFVESAANDQATCSEWTHMSDVNRTATSEQGWRRKELTPRRNQSTQARQLTACNKNSLARVTLRENKITPNRTTLYKNGGCLVV